MRDKSVHAVVTDPPAGISFMGKEWDSDKGGRDEWIKWLTGVMRECFRVLKPGGHALVWALPRTSHWTATALENAGFEVRDCITHLFGTGFPKSLNISKAIDKAAGAEREVIGVSPSARPNHQKGNSGHQRLHDNDNPHATAMLTAAATDDAKRWQGWGTGLKPACEFWVLCRKPVEEDSVAANVLEHGTGGLNIGACRIGTEIIKSEHRDTAAWSGNNWSAKPQKSNGVVTESVGRWPANLVLSHNAECGTETVPSGDCTEGCAVKVLDAQSGASRFFYCAKASQAERNEGCDGLPLGEPPGSKRSTPAEGRSGALGESRANHHPTVKAVRLMSYLCRLITPPGGTVLDPFMGSGSTGVAALAEKFNFVGIELNKEYFDIAVARLKSAEAKVVELNPAEQRKALSNKLGGFFAKLREKQITA